MGKKQPLLTVVLAMVAGFVGGVGSSWFLRGSPVFAQKTPESAKVIQAEKFEVVDKDGTVRAMLGMEDDKLGMEDDKGPRLDLYDKNPNRRVTFHSLDPWIGMTDHNGQLRARLELFLGEPYLSLYDAYGKSRAEVNPSDFNIRDQNNQSRAGLNLTADGEPHLDLFDKRGKTRAWFGIRGDGEPHLALADKDEKVGAGLTLTDGEPALDLYDKKGKTRATFGYAKLKNMRTGSEEKRFPNSLVLFGEDGKLIWQAP